MLESLRHGANTWIAKLLLGLLVLSFVGWGIFTRQLGDLNGGTRTLIQVGGQNVTAQQYQQMFGTELQKLNIQMHQTIPAATAHQLGLDQQVFTGLLLDAHARELNLGISDAALTGKLAAQKALQTADGRFDAGQFRLLLRNLNMSEGSYLGMLRRDTVREQLLGSVGAGAPAPQVLIDAVNQFEGEARTLSYFIVPPGKAPAAAAPEADKLKDFYEAHKEQYRAPEMRKVGALLASPDDIKATIAVSDNELKAEFDRTRASLGTPERRHVQLMSFQDKAMVDKALAAIKTGKDFMAVAKDMGLTEKDVDHGVIVKGELFDKVAGEAAFKLEKDKVSDPVEGELATSLIRVTEIQPGLVKTFDDVKADIKDKLARERAIKALIDFRGKIEDARAAGTQLKDLPGKFPFKYTELPPMDKSGNGAGGKPVSPLADLTAIVKAGFAGDVGVESDPIDLGKNGWAWVEVKEVKPARQKPLDEVKADVTAAYQENEANAALGKLALQLADRANKGEDFAKLAAEGGGEVKTAASLTRRGTNPDLPKGAAQLAFALAKGSAASLTAADGKSKIVFKVDAITPAKPVDEAKRKEMGAALAQQTAGALSAQYIAALGKTYGFTLDQAQFKQLTQPGGELPDQTDQ